MHVMYHSNRPPVGRRGYPLHSGNSEGSVDDSYIVTLAIKMPAEGRYSGNNVALTRKQQAKGKTHFFARIGHGRQIFEAPTIELLAQEIMKQGDKSLDLEVHAGEVYASHRGSSRMKKIAHSKPATIGVDGSGIDYVQALTALLSEAYWDQQHARQERVAGLIRHFEEVQSQVNARNAAASAAAERLREARELQERAQREKERAEEESRISKYYHSKRNTF